MGRRLAAILSIDVVGYSRLMERDEATTLAALKAHRDELIGPHAALHGGTTIKLMGDGALMEFTSAVDAVRFAVAVQLAMRGRNAGLAEGQRITFRIGINVGDVIAEDGDIHGDGVNLAARLEALAEPGGICIHRSVRDQVRDKLPLDFEDLGEVEVKNIERSFRAFHVVLDDKAEVLASASAEMSQRPQRELPSPLGPRISGHRSRSRVDRRGHLVATLGSKIRAGGPGSHGTSPARDTIDRRAAVRKPVGR
jgi:adenylate cyclase